jgi:hypothetical protein
MVALRDVGEYELKAASRRNALAAVGRAASMGTISPGGAADPAPTVRLTA